MRYAHATADKYQLGVNKIKQVNIILHSYILQGFLACGIEACSCTCFIITTFGKMKTVSPTRTFTAVAMSSKGKVIHFCHLDFQICIGNEKDFSRTSLGPLQLGSVFTSAFLPKINYCTDKN